MISVVVDRHTREPDLQASQIAKTFKKIKKSRSLVCFFITVSFNKSRMITDHSGVWILVR